ncbi:MAG: hypothetical protein N2039_08630, partial [Gemmataceae bacterium]|nr:hypothetical protein [Gemmataceae bacterium]
NSTSPGWMLALDAGVLLLLSMLGPGRREDSDMANGWRGWARGLAAVLLVFGMASGSLATLFWAVGVGPMRGVKSAPERYVGPIGPIAVEPGDLDIGEVWETTYHRHPVRVRNLSNQPIAIEGFEVSCRTCMDVEEAGLRLGPGESGLIHLKFEFWYRYLSQFHDATRPLQQQFRPIFADESLNRATRGQNWEVVGTIRSRAAVRALAMDFGEALVRGGKPVRRKLDVRVHVPHDRLEAVSYHPGVGVQFQPRSDADGRYDMIVEASPLIPVGPFQTEIHVYVHERGGHRAWAFMLPVFGNVQPSVRLMPSTLNLGKQPLGTEFEEFVTVLGLHGDDASIDGHPVGSSGVAIERLPSTDRRSPPMFRIRVHIDTIGEGLKKLQFCIRGGDGNVVLLELPIIFDGIVK